MKFFAAAVGALVLPFTFTDAAVLFKRSEQIHLRNYKYENDILSGEADVLHMNCARQNPRVQVFWARGDSWQELALEAGRNGQTQGNRPYELYSFYGNAVNATQFYLKYTCYKQEFYDPGNFVNYQIKTTA
ncbi:hypothetical protein ABW20_dc0104472 [Dactylellina cionopaga]|nr:hypothetical protein ABW20_dc0104472 [Dactylellina cionopaga]